MFKVKTITSTGDRLIRRLVFVDAYIWIGNKVLSVNCCEMRTRAPRNNKRRNTGKKPLSECTTIKFSYPCNAIDRAWAQATALECSSYSPANWGPPFLFLSVMQSLVVGDGNLAVKQIVHSVITEPETVVRLSFYAIVSRNINVCHAELCAYKCRSNQSTNTHTHTPNCLSCGALICGLFWDFSCMKYCHNVSHIIWPISRFGSYPMSIQRHMDDSAQFHCIHRKSKLIKFSLYDNLIFFVVQRIWPAHRKQSIQTKPMKYDSRIILWPRLCFSTVFLSRQQNYQMRTIHFFKIINVFPPNANGVTFSWRL